MTAGNLLVVRSKCSTTNTNATVTVSTSAGVSLTWNTVSLSSRIGVLGGAYFQGVLAYAVIPSTGAQTVRAVWAGGASAQFSDISVAEYSATSGWLSSPLDQSSMVLLV